MATSVLFEGLEPDTLAEQIASMWVGWDVGRAGWKKLVAEVRGYVYATDTKFTTNGENWGHTTHIPKLTQIYDNLGANYASALFGSRDWFAFDPGNQSELDAQRRLKIEAYLQTKHRLSGFVVEQEKCLDDWTQCGNCFGMVEYVRDIVTDPQTNQERVLYEGPMFSRIDPMNIVFDYRATSFDSSPKIIRTLTDIGQLLTRFENLEGSDTSTWDPATIEKVRAIRQAVAAAKPEDVKKNYQAQADGFNPYAYFTSHDVELLTFYGDIFDAQSNVLHRGVEIIVVDRQWVLSNAPINTLDRKPKIFHAGWRIRPDNLWAMGPLDNLVGMQYMIDHLENARADAFDKMLTPDRVIVGTVMVEEDGPVTTYIVPDGNGSVTTVGPDPTVLNADFQIQVKEAQMEAYAGAPREAMGVRSPGEKTKFEVNLLANAASRMFQHKIEKYESTFLEPVLNAELEVAVMFLETTDVAKVFDDDKDLLMFLDITKEDLRASGKLLAQGASHFAKKSQLVQELQTFETVLATSGDLKVHFPAKERAKLWSELMDWTRYGIYKPFGGIAEQVEMASYVEAAKEAEARSTAGINVAGEA